MADEPAPPSVASHTSVLSNILAAIMHLIAVSPNAPSAASAAVSAAHREMATWTPPVETPPAPPEQWQGQRNWKPDGSGMEDAPPAEAEPGPDPAEPITEATGDGPPDDGDQPMEADMPTPEHTPAG